MISCTKFKYKYLFILKLIVWEKTISFFRHGIITSNKQMKPVDLF